MTNAGTGKSVLLDVKGLKKYFPIRRGLLQKTVGLVKAVDDVSFFLNQGETLSLVGESGCGKTTTARCILRAITPTAGQVLLSDNGEVVDVATVPKVSQDWSLAGAKGPVRSVVTGSTAAIASAPAAMGSLNASCRTSA